MIENPVKHQMIPAFKVFYIRPGPEIGVNGLEIRDGKSPVGGVREKGEEMKRIDGSTKICVAKFGQICEGGAFFTAQEIPVSDQDDILLGKSFFRIKPLFFFYQCGVRGCQAVNCGVPDKTAWKYYNSPSDPI